MKNNYPVYGEYRKPPVYTNTSGYSGGYSGTSTSSTSSASTGSSGFGFGRLHKNKSALSELASGKKDVTEFVYKNGKLVKLKPGTKPEDVMKQADQPVFAEGNRNGTVV